MILRHGGDISIFEKVGKANVSRTTLKNLKRLRLLKNFNEVGIVSFMPRTKQDEK